MDDKESVMYVELARNFAAGYIAYQMGIRSIDYTRKNYVAQEVGDFWVEVAQSVDMRMQQAGAKAMSRLHDDEGGPDKGK